MSITGMYNTKFEIGDEVLYLDPNDRQTPYLNGVVRAVIPIANGEDRLNVLLDNGDYVYHNASKFVNVYKMHTAKIKPTFRKGDRVLWEDRKATVSTDRYNDYYYSIFLDQPYNGYQYFTVHEEKIMADAIKPEKEYTIKCAEWFKTAYVAITKAGGCPDHIIEQIPPDLLETLIRNDIKLYYKK